MPDPNWIDLVKQSQEAFKNRRELEWKLALGSGPVSHHLPPHSL